MRENKKIPSFWTRFTREERGVTLLEILLVVGVLASISVGLVTLMDSWAEQQKTEKVARHLRVVHAAAEAYLRDNFSAIQTAVTLSGGSMEIPIDDGENDADETTSGVYTWFLKSGGTYLPANYQERTIYGQPFTVLVRSPDATTLEAMVVTSVRPYDLQAMMSVANAAGASAGLITGRNIGNFRTNRFTGAFNTWQRNLALYGTAATNWQAADTTTMAQDEAHLAAIIEVDGSDILENYMFRVDVDASTVSENRMFTDLDMNGNSFDNLNAAVADKADIAGALNVNAPVMTVSGGLTVENDATIGGEMTIDGTLELSGLLNSGNVNVGNNSTINTINGQTSAILDIQDTGITTGLNAVDVISTTTDVNAGTIDSTGTGQFNVTNMTLGGTADVAGFGATQATGASVNITGNFISRNAVNLSGGNINLGSPDLRDFNNATGSFDPLAPNAVSLDAVIGSRSTANCATSTNGNCN